MPKKEEEKNPPSPDFLNTKLETISVELAQISQSLSICGQRINLQRCINVSPSRRNSPPSTKMVSQSLQALCGAVYLDSDRNLSVLKQTVDYLQLFGDTQSNSTTWSVSVASMET